MYLLHRGSFHRHPPWHSCHVGMLCGATQQKKHRGSMDGLDLSNLSDICCLEETLPSTVNHFLAHHMIKTFPTPNNSNFFRAGPISHFLGPRPEILSLLIQPILTSPRPAADIKKLVRSLSKERGRRRRGWDRYALNLFSLYSLSLSLSISFKIFKVARDERRPSSVPSESQFLEWDVFRLE